MARPKGWGGRQRSWEAGKRECLREQRASSLQDLRPGSCDPALQNQLRIHQICLPQPQPTHAPLMSFLARAGCRWCTAPASSPARVVCTERSTQAL